MPVIKLICIIKSKWLALWEPLSLIFLHVNLNDTQSSTILKEVEDMTSSMF